MKIAHVLGTFDRTGITTVVIQLSKTMANSGHNIDIIVWDCNNIPKLPNNVNVVAINVFGLSRRPLLGKYIRKFHKRFLTDVIYYYLYSSFFSKLIEKKIFSHNNYHQVFFHGMRYYPFCKVNFPHVVVAHNTKSRSLLNTTSYIKNTISKYCIKYIYRGKTILTVSNGVRDDLINNFSVNKKNIFCVYNPFDIEDIKKKSNAFTPAFNPKNGYILAAGRASKQKRFDVLLNAYALSNISEYLVIIGSNQKHFNGLKKLASKLNISHKVHFIDHQDNPFPFIKQAKLVVVTSEYEGFGNTIVESLICGVPVVSTDCMSGPNEILIGELKKYLAKTNNITDIANKIKMCLSDNPKINSANLARFDDNYVAFKYLEHIIN
ncbi:MAG: glycosyltransferase [Gammaproteobacteria bacterium]|nr:MAG: glycosyltransferase [Gammaproteobacteria bacterium]